MLTELATHMEPAVSVVPDGATVAVLGLGYVGLPVALTCAGAGFHVVGINSDPERVRVLRDAAVDGPEVFPLSSALRGGNLAVTHDPARFGRADAVFICVPTPLEEGEARCGAVRACAAAFARHGRPDALVILESTVRPGFVEELCALLGPGGRVALAYAPERIDPQRSQEGMPLREIPRLVAGVNDSAQERATTLQRAMGVGVHPVPLRVAEYAEAAGELVPAAQRGLHRRVRRALPRRGHRPARRHRGSGDQADIGEARRLLGFEPVVTFDAGIRRTVAWFQAQRAGVAA